MKRLIVLAGLLAALGSASSSLAADPPQVFAIENVRIVVAPGKVIETGTVVLRDGIIEAASASATPPADAKVWDGEGKTVYPGLIEAYSPRQRPTADASDDDGDSGTSSGHPASHPNSIVTPEYDVLDDATDDSLTQKLRNAGFTSALAVPASGLIRGRAALLNNGDGSLRDNLLVHRAAQTLSFDRSPSGYPESTMGAVALLRQSLLDAAWYSKAHASYRSNPAQSRPAFSLANEVLSDVAAGEELVLFATGDLADSLRAAALIKEMKLRAYLLGNGQEYRRLDAVAATGLPHLLPVVFPEAPDVGEEAALDVPLEELRHWESAPTNPKALLDRGVEVAFTTYGLSDPKTIYPSLAKAIEQGLTPDQALAGLTTTPAKLLGISSRTGTLEPGKMANLILTDGDLFVEKPKISDVWVDGRHYELREIKPPEVNPVGTWAVVVNAGGQKIPVNMTISGELGNLSGSIGTPAGSLPLTSAEVSGKILYIVFNSTPLGMPGEISMNFDISGESAKGTGESPQGPFTLTANRSSGPEAK